MQIKVNGKLENYNFETIFLANFLSNKNLKNVAVELNGDIIDPKDFSSTMIKNNDVLEIIMFMGGGINRNPKSEKIKKGKKDDKL